jgi:hypothetical protein
VSGLPFDDIPDPIRAAQAIAPMEAPRERSPTRAGRRTRMVLAALLSFVWVLLLTLRFGVRDDLAAIGAKIAALVALGAVTLGLVLRSGARGRPAGIRLLQALLVAVALVYVFVAVATSLPALEGRAAWQGMLPCFLTTLLLSFGPLLFASFVFARSFSTIPAWRGAAIGAIVGLLGSIGIDAHCTNDAYGHVLLAHGLPVVALALIGAAFGARYGKLA